ncbi:hypothetical protein [Halopelagius longus]|uniref:Uncharacterized protein n=1 Tax=Halopelagius longus TaxID=1236180 RepID=A0A1H1FYH9_9EURY|nr:hypothetical protein [Halopelagius longus]RDI69951.1 hypothetical protein DWB78_17555 [Halopelagius longus]SDR06003.1 hypothetical protein SAMN05216278_3402 [Halopelagius longus]
MSPSDFSALRVARIAAGAAAATGLYGVLALSGVVGAVACPADSAAGEGTNGRGGEVAAAAAAARTCPGGLAYVLDGAGGRAPELFVWPAVLLGLVAVGAVAVWTGRRRLAWTTVFAGLAASGVGFLSVGRYFLPPTLFLLVGAVALSVEASRGPDGSGE